MSASLRRTPAVRSERRAKPRAIWAGAERRASDPFSQLSRRLEVACQGAVQPLELAAVLESEGYTDAMVRERFGAHDIFDCAHQLYDRVPYRPPDVTATTLPRPVPVARDLSRGLIYLMPALWTPFAMPLSNAADAAQVTTTGLLTATLFGWGWMQGVAHRGYQALARGPALAARTLARTGLQATILTTLLTAAVGWNLHLDPVATGVVGLAMAVYLSSATTLLVLGQERLLLSAAVPVSLLILAELSGLARPQPHWLILLLAVGAPLIQALLAVRRAGKPAAFDLPGPQRAWWYAAYGWLCAAFLSARILNPWAPDGSDPSSVVGLSWSVAPLVLSMGALELTLRRGHHALGACARSNDPAPVILRRATSLLARRVAGYVGGLALAYAVVAVTLPYLGGTPLPTPLLAGHVLVGAALLLSGYLINVGLLSWALLTWGAALAVQATARSAGLAADPAYLIGAVLAALLSAGLTFWALRDARHLQ